MLQNSLLRCERAIIESKWTVFLNRRCALVLVLESILLILVVKIVLQHIRARSGHVATAGDWILMFADHIRINAPAANGMA